MWRIVCSILILAERVGLSLGWCLWYVVRKEVRALFSFCRSGGSIVFFFYVNKIFNRFLVNW